MLRRSISPTSEYTELTASVQPSWDLSLFKFKSFRITTRLCTPRSVRMKAIIFISVVLPLVSSVSHPIFLGFIQGPKQRLKPLCDLGCKCPEDGQKLIFMDCGSRDISKLPSSLQLDAPITKVTFQGNHLTNVAMSTFISVSDIQELDLSFNQITDIDDYALSPFKSLAALHLAHNRLSHVEPGLLERLDNLRVLELGHNNIQDISYLAFKSTPNLQELRIQYNPIFNLQEGVFQSLPKLEKLDLQETGLVSLPSGLFNDTPRLRWLSLSNNAFETVPEKALREAALLDSLDLSGNDFIILEAGSFSRLSNLSLLNLNNLQRLTKVEREAFAGLAKLKSLSCSYNPMLTFIDKDVFGGQNSSYSKLKTPPREQLFLRQNALRTLSSPLEIKSWSSLSFVDFGDNPWKCDCNLEWMTHLKQETRMNIICDSPPHLRGRPLSSIHRNELTCDGRWHFVTFVLVISSMIAFGVVFLAASAVVCSRTPLGLYVRAKYQFSYAKVAPKTETVDLEWDPSADM